MMRRAEAAPERRPGAEALAASLPLGIVGLASPRGYRKLVSAH
jgi:hypothetical protein